MATKTTPRFKTAPQVFYGLSTLYPITTNGNGRTAVLPHNERHSDHHFDDILRDPTVKLAVDVVMAMMMQQPWSIEGENEDYCNFVWQQIEAHRKNLIRSMFRGLLKNGWRVFETTFGFTQDEKLGLRQTIAGIKPLRNRLTDVIIDAVTGERIGAENYANPYGPVFVDTDHIIFFNVEDDGFGNYGEPLLRTVKPTQDKWDDCDEGAQRYDKKVAGGFLHLKYPEGVARDPSTGEEVDNAVIANRFMAAVRSSGHGITPVRIDENDGDPKLLDAWKLEHVAASVTSQPSFVTRLKYLDALKLRAFGIPERSTVEGTFGTKAEAEAHADVAVLVNTQRHERLIEATNRDLIEPFNRSNFGDPAACRLVLGKLDPQDRALFQTIFTSLMSDPLLGDSVAKRVDVDLLLEKLDVPTITEVPVPTTEQNF